MPPLDQLDPGVSMWLTWLLEDRLAAASMPWPEDVPELIDAGIGAVLSLTLRNPFPGGPPAGLTHLHLPVEDMTAPGPGLLTAAVRFLDDQIGAGRATVVHCGAGLGRTGTVLACYLVSTGASPDEALERVRAARPGSVETFEQEECVRAFAAAKEAGNG